MRRAGLEAVRAVEARLAAGWTRACALQPRGRIRLFFQHVVAFVLFTAVFYRIFPIFLPQNHDGQNLYYLAAEIFEWKASALDVFTFSPLSGMGSTFWPLNPTLIPFLMPFKLVDDPTLRIYLLAILASAMIFAASLLFFVSLRLPSHLALGAAWLSFVVFTDGRLPDRDRSHHVRKWLRRSESPMKVAVRVTWAQNNERTARPGR